MDDELTGYAGGMTPDPSIPLVSLPQDGKKMCINDPASDCQAEIFPILEAPEIKKKRRRHRKRKPKTVPSNGTEDIPIEDHLAQQIDEVSELNNGKIYSDTKNEIPFLSEVCDQKVLFLGGKFEDEIEEILSNESVISDNVTPETKSTECIVLETPIKIFVDEISSTCFSRKEPFPHVSGERNLKSMSSTMLAKPRDKYYAMTSETQFKAEDWMTPEDILNRNFISNSISDEAKPASHTPWTSQSDGSFSQKRIVQTDSAGSLPLPTVPFPSTDISNPDMTHSIDFIQHAKEIEAQLLSLEQSNSESDQLQSPNIHVSLILEKRFVSDVEISGCFNAPNKYSAQTQQTASNTEVSFECSTDSNSNAEDLPKPSDSMNNLLILEDCYVSNYSKVAEESPEEMTPVNVFPDSVIKDSIYGSNIHHVQPYRASSFELYQSIPDTLETSSSISIDLRNRMELENLSYSDLLQLCNHESIDLTKSVSYDESVEVFEVEPYQEVVDSGIEHSEKLSVAIDQENKTATKNQPTPVISVSEASHDRLTETPRRPKTPNARETIGNPTLTLSGSNGSINVIDAGTEQSKLKGKTTVALKPALKMKPAEIAANFEYDWPEFRLVYNQPSVRNKTSANSVPIKTTKSFGRRFIDGVLMVVPCGRPKNDSDIAEHANDSLDCFRSETNISSMTPKGMPSTHKIGNKKRNFSLPRKFRFFN